MAIIETKALTKSYGKKRGIAGLDLAVEEGEFFGFIGPEGAGKSTTIRTLLGLLSPTSGQAEIFGKDIVRQKKEILKDVGYMPSEAIFYGSMKIKKVIAFSAKLRRKKCAEEAKRLCERLSLSTNWRINELSLSGRKKVSIVCALQHKPRLCILDEPTNGLDPLVQKEFFDILRERQQDGATIFLSTHVLSEVQKNCSRAAIIKEGRLVALDGVENMARHSARRVTLHGMTSAPEMPGVKAVETAENYVSFLYDGDIKELLRTTANLPIYDISIAEPELDETFMSYYESPAAE